MRIENVLGLKRRGTHILRMVQLSLAPVLVIDDSADDLFFARRSLAFARIKNPILTINGGEEAIAYLSNAPSPLPCAAFVDLKMPMVSGFDFLAWAKKQDSLKELKVIIMSGSDERQDHDRAVAMGADGYVVKYPGVDSLLDALKSATCIERT